MYSDSSEFSSEHLYLVESQWKCKRNFASAHFEVPVSENSGMDDRISLLPNFPCMETETCNGACVDPHLLQHSENFQAMLNQGMGPLQLLKQLQKDLQFPDESDPNKIHGHTREDELRYTRAVMRLLQKSLHNMENCGKPDPVCSSHEQMDLGYNTQDTSSVGTVESIGQHGINSIDCSLPNGQQEVRPAVKQIDPRAHLLPKLVTIATKVEPSKLYLPHDDSTSSDDDDNSNPIAVLDGDIVVSEDEPLQSNPVGNESFCSNHLDSAKGFHNCLDVAEEVESAQPTRLRHSAGNEPDPFVKFYTVRLHGRGNQLTARSVLKLAHFVRVFGAPPISMTYNSLGNVVIQVEDEDQGLILTRTTSIGGFDIETKPHSTLNNVTGIVVSEKLWKEGCSTKVVQQLAHEGVISATMFDPLILQDGTVSLPIGITFGNRSSLAISVKTRSGQQLDVRVWVVPPKQCLICFRFGHETQQCRESDAICKNCSKYRDYHLQPCKQLTRCANCGSSRHGALSRQCFALYKAWRVNIVAFTESVAFMEAKKQVDDEVQDCQRRGGDYVKEFPLTSRYFLIVPQEHLRAFGSGLQTNTMACSSTARGIITCSYPEMLTIADPGEYMNCSQLLDYYSINDIKVGVVQPLVKNVALRSPTASRSTENRWSLSDKPPPSLQRQSLLKKQVASANNNSDCSPYRDPVGMFSSYCRNRSYESTDEVLDHMPLLIHAVNRFFLKVLNVGMLTKADSPVGLVNFYAKNLRCVSVCWQEANVRSTINSNLLVIKRTTNNSGTICNDDHHDNSILDKLVQGDTLDVYTDVYAASRCKRFVRGIDCSENCNKMHKLPKEDGIRCIFRKLGQCHYGRKCNFLHDFSDENNEPFVVRGCNGNKYRNYDDNTNFDYDGGAVEGVYYDGRSSSSSEDDDSPSTAMAVGPILRLFNQCKN